MIDKTDDELEGKAKAERERKAKEVERQQAFFDLAIKRRSQGMWGCGALLLGPFVVLLFLLDRRLDPVWYVAFGIGWACVAGWGFRLERSLQADVDARLDFLNEARNMETPASDELERLATLKRLEQKRQGSAG